MATGRSPLAGQGVGMPDFMWLLGLAGGDNLRTQSGVTALAGGGQAGATLLGGPDPSGLPAAAVEVDTVATAADSVALPFAVVGRWMLIRNAGANSMNVYALSANNKATGAQDSINGGANNAAVAVAANHGAIAFCAKNGVWTLLVV